jgi:hypothetical protein
MAYATTAELKTYLGITGDTDDGLIAGLLDRATEAIDNYTGRTFNASTATARTFDAIGPHISGPTLWLDKDACAFSSVTNGDGVSVSASEYVTIPRNGAPYHGLRLKTSSGKVWTYSTDWEGAITVTANWGYSTTPPADIVQACVQYAAFMYRKKDAPMQDITAIEAGVAITPVAVPGDVRAILDHYKRY